jgi:hypothetical protein
MVGMRLSALRLPLITRGRIYLWCVVVSRVRARSRAARTISHSLLPGLTWLDPAIHAERRLAETYRNGFGWLHRSMDHPDKPGGDKEGGVDASVSEAIQMACAGIGDCFVAVAPRNDERLSAPAQRSAAGRGTTRSVVEGVCGGAEADREAVATPTALRAVPPPRWAGRDKKASHEN